MPKTDMEFGLKTAIPDSAKAGWGARLIFPDDLVWDRQSHFADDQQEWGLLKGWLNGEGALKKALESALQMSNRYEITPRMSKRVTLYEDATGIVVGNPNASHGYLYIAAWLKG